MSDSPHVPLASRAVPRPWDARLARRLVTPLKDSWITPNYLTTVRLAIGLCAAAAFVPGIYVWSNLGAVLLILSNFLEHTDGELARMSGKSSRAGHVYDLASDAAVTILLFIALGVGVGTHAAASLRVPPVALWLVAGCAVALIFFLRMRIEEMAGKAANQQASLVGIETEDVLYLLPLVTLGNAEMPFLITAALCAPMFAIWVFFDYRRVVRYRTPAVPQ